MNKFKFELNGKTFVVIDWSNVYDWFKDNRDVYTCE